MSVLGESNDVAAAECPSSRKNTDSVSDQIALKDAFKAAVLARKLKAKAYISERTDDQTLQVETVELEDQHTMKAVDDFE
jgi:hypothetical protein